MTFIDLIHAHPNLAVVALAVFLEARFPSAKEQKEEAYRKGFEEGRKYLRGFR